MPESTPVMTEFVEKQLRKVVSEGCGRFLDVGAGTGKYGKAIRKLAGGHVWLEAVELESDYISKYKLNDIYNNIFVMDIVDFMKEYVDLTYDVVIMADILEHLRKSVGMDALNFFVYRSKYIIITYPVKFVHFSYEGYKSEAHISVWGEEDFSLFESTHISESYMRLVIIRGYRG